VGDNVDRYVESVSALAAFGLLPLTFDLQTLYITRARSPFLIDVSELDLPLDVVTCVVLVVLTVSFVGPLPKRSFAEWLPPVTFRDSRLLPASAAAAPKATSIHRG